MPSVLSVKYLYCNWHQFVLWVHVEQTQASCHMQRVTIMYPGGYSIHDLLVTDEDISFLSKQRKEAQKLTGDSKF